MRLQIARWSGALLAVASLAHAQVLAPAQTVYGVEGAHTVLDASCARDRVKACRAAFPRFSQYLAANPSYAGVSLTLDDARGEFPMELNDPDHFCPANSGFKVVQSIPAGVLVMGRSLFKACVSLRAGRALANGCPPGFKGHTYGSKSLCVYQTTEGEYALGTGLKELAHCDRLAVEGPDINQCEIRVVAESRVLKLVKDERTRVREAMLRACKGMSPKPEQCDEMVQAADAAASAPK